MDYIELNKKNTKLLLDKTDEKRILKLKRSRYNTQIDMFNKYINSNASVLDIGIRDGVFLDMLRGMGFTDLYGIDIFERSISLLKSKGIPGHVANAQDFILKKNFDLVVMSHVLEHCPSPDIVLTNVHNHLNRNGVLFIEVPIEKGDPIPTEKDAHYFNFQSIQTMFDLIGNNWMVLEKFVSEKRIKVVLRKA